MRRIVLFDRVSADGYFSAPDGSLDWVVQEETLDQEAGSSSASPGRGTLLLGRRTYESFEGFWRQFDDDGSTPVPDPHDPERHSNAMRAMATYINDATKVVLSKTLREVTWRNARLLREFDPREIEAMKNEPGKDIRVFGSGSLVTQLTEHGLIDEYQLIVGPILLGEGRSWLGGIARHVRLNLVEVKQYPAGNVMLRYTPQA